MRHCQLVYCTVLYVLVYCTQIQTDHLLLQLLIVLYVLVHCTDTNRPSSAAAAYPISDKNFLIDIFSSNFQEFFYDSLSEIPLFKNLINIFNDNIFYYVIIQFYTRQIRSFFVPESRDERETGDRISPSSIKVG